MAPIKILVRAENTQPSRGMLRCSHLINYLIIWNTVFQIVMSQSSTNRNCFMGLRKPPGAASVLRLQLTVQWSRENDKKKKQRNNLLATHSHSHIPTNSDKFGRSDAHRLPVQS